MEQVLGRIGENTSDEIRVSLREIQGDLYVEVWIASRPARQGRASVREQTIVVPLEGLSNLCRILVQTQDRVLKDGLMRTAARVSEAMPATDESVPFQEADPQPPRRYKRREPRISVRLPVEAYPLSTQDSSHSAPGGEKVTGTMKDVSHGGAQIWLAEHFPPPESTRRLLEDWKRHLPRTRTSGRIGCKTKGWSIQTQPSLAVAHRPSEGCSVEADRLFRVISAEIHAGAMRIRGAFRPRSPESASRSTEPETASPGADVPQDIAGPYRDTSARHHRSPLRDRG